MASDSDSDGVDVFDLVVKTGNAADLLYFLQTSLSTLEASAVPPIRDTFKALWRKVYSCLPGDHVELKEGNRPVGAARTTVERTAARKRKNTF